MSSFDEPSRPRAVSRLALMAAFAAGLAGCSSDFSRFEGQHWAGKPQASNDVTGSVQPAPSHKVESAALPAPTYGGSAGIGTPARQEVTGSVNTSSYPRPTFIYDFAPERARNAVAVIGAYAALCRE